MLQTGPGLHVFMALRYNLRPTILLSPLLITVICPQYKSLSAALCKVLRGTAATFSTMKENFRSRIIRSFVNVLFSSSYCVSCRGQQGADCEIMFVHLKWCVWCPPLYLPVNLHRRSCAKHSLFSLTRPQEFTWWGLCVNSHTPGRFKGPVHIRTSYECKQNDL